MNEVVNQVMQRTGLSQDKAEQAVQVVVNFLKQRLPGPMAGQLDNALQGGGSGVSEKIGDILGKKSA